MIKIVSKKKWDDTQADLNWTNKKLDEVNKERSRLAKDIKTLREVYILLENKYNELEKCSEKEIKRLLELCSELEKEKQLLLEPKTDGSFTWVDGWVSTTMPTSETDTKAQIIENKPKQNVAVKPKKKNKK